MKVKKITYIAIAGILLLISQACTFAIGTLDWYTAGTGEDVLYTSDGQPGVGDTSLFEVSGGDPSLWYAMIYDADALDVGTFDVSNYASVEDARNAVMNSELYGGSYLTMISGTPQYSYIYQEGIQDDSLSNKRVGTILFNTADPNALDLSGMMFAYSTTITTDPLPDFTPSEGTDPTATYNAGVIGFNGAEWVAVPEPATALFGLVGIAALAIARRRRQ